MLTGSRQTTQSTPVDERRRRAGEVDEEVLQDEHVRHDEPVKHDEVRGPVQMGAGVAGGGFAVVAAAGTGTAAGAGDAIRSISMMRRRSEQWLFSPRGDAQGVARALRRSG